MPPKPSPRRKFDTQHKHHGGFHAKPHHSFRSAPEALQPSPDANRHETMRLLWMPRRWLSWKPGGGVECRLTRLAPAGSSPELISFALITWSDSMKARRRIASEKKASLLDDRAARAQAILAECSNGVIGRHRSPSTPWQNRPSSGRSSRRMPSSSVIFAWIWRARRRDGFIGISELGCASKTIAWRSLKAKVGVACRNAAIASNPRGLKPDPSCEIGCVMLSDLSIPLRPGDATSGAFVEEFSLGTAVAQAAMHSGRGCEQCRAGPWRRRAEGREGNADGESSDDAGVHADVCGLVAKWMSQSNLLHSEKNLRQKAAADHTARMSTAAAKLACKCGGG